MINETNAKAIAEALLSAKTKMFNKTDDELMKMILDDEGNVTDNAADQLLTLDQSRVTRLKEEGQTKFNNGYAKAKEEERKAAANLVKDTLGITVDGSDLEQILTVGKEQIEEKSKKGKQEITDDMIKKHPVYLQLEKERVPQEKYDELNNTFTDYKSKVERKEKFSSIRSVAKRLLDDMNPVYPEANNVRDNLVNVYLVSLEKYDYADDGNGGHIVIEADGSRKQDAHGNPITLEQIAKQHAGEFFTFKKQEEKGSAGAKNTPPPGNENGKGLVFNNEMDYVNYMQQFKGDTKEDMEGRVKGMAAHREAKSAGRY